MANKLVDSYPLPKQEVLVIYVIYILLVVGRRRRELENISFKSIVINRLLIELEVSTIIPLNKFLF